MIPTLRPCQDDLLDAIIAEYQKGHRRVLARAETGFGKTVTFSAITLRSMRKNKRVIIMAHRTEIVDQISRALDSFGVRHGRIQTGHTMTDDPIQIGMVITVSKRIDKLPVPDLIIIDECHHACTGSYKVVTQAWPHAHILGVTATPERLDRRGLDDDFDVMVQAIPMAKLIEQGYLAQFTYLAPPTKVDLSGIKTRLGDYAADQLAEAMDKAVITGDSIDHYRTYLAGRPAIAFAVTVEHAEHIAAQFNAAGFRAASVDGSMDKKVRKDRIAGIGDGRLNVLTSCEILGEGVDIPVVSGAILLRPTKSLSLYLQQVGRVLRPKPDGSNAIILDHVGNVHAHGMPDMEREWTLAARKKRDSGPGVATCKQCFRAFQVQPDWKEEETCLNGQPEGCILDPTPVVAAKGTPEIVEGKLSIITTTPDWAGGRDIARVKGPELVTAINMADTPEKLREIAKARGYHPGWIRHILNSRKAA